jgi:hypothetical protein
MKSLQRSCTKSSHVNPFIINKTQANNRVRFSYRPFTSWRWKSHHQRKNRKRVKNVLTVHSSTTTEMWREKPSKDAKADETLERRGFQGACLDKSVQTSVVGLAQAKAYCRYRGVRFKTKASGKASDSGRRDKSRLETCWCAYWFAYHSLTDHLSLLRWVL